MPRPTKPPVKTLPVYTNDQIATQLVSGYWDYTGRGQRSFDVAPGGTLTVNLTGLNEDGAFLARSALEIWTDVTGITFSEVSSEADILFQDSEAGAYSNSVTTGSTITSSIVNVSTNWLETEGTGLNSYSFQTYIHEIGHAIGLGHAGNYNGKGTYPRSTQYANDSWATSVMSYFSQAENTYFRDEGFTALYVGTPMAADALATTTLYGAVTTTRTGNTTYGFNNTSGRAIYDATANPDIAYTIFDNGGIDTLDYSGFADNQRIDLTPEAFSNVGGNIGNVVIARGVVIENVIGGTGSDVILGNSAANNLNGGGGADTLTGGDGADTLTGGSGNDVFRGTAAQLAGDTVTDLTAGDRIHITDGVLASVSASGTTLNLGGGRTLTLSNGAGKSFTVSAASDGGVNVVVAGTVLAAAGADNVSSGTTDREIRSAKNPKHADAAIVRSPNLELMIQDMAAFGGSGGEGLSLAGQRGGELRYDYFAAAA